jgi:peptide/nickel transport system substrate-binding protein
LIWALVVACLLAACSGGGGDGDRPAAEPARPGEVRIGVGEDIWPLTGEGPSSKHFAAGELNVGVYEPLLSLAPDYSVRPGLAERWELVGPTTWRFHLRPGVRWHDGRPFGADDVVWSWTGRQFLPRAITGALDRVVKIDDLTVDFVTTAPNLRLPEQLVHPEGPIVPKDGHNDSTPPVGTGPFKVVDYQPRRQVVVERYDGYWGTKAAAERLTFRFMPDAELRLEALRSGEVDVITGLPRDRAASVEADPRFAVVKTQPGATQVLSFNAASSVAAERPVREAVALTVDRSRYVAEILGGNGEPGRWMSPPAVLGAAASSVDPLPFDPDKARQLLDDAGWRPGPDGIRAKGPRRLELVVLGGPAVPEAGLRLVAAQLRDAGMQVTVKKAFDIRTAEENRQREYDLELGMSNQNDANPAFLVASRTEVADPEYPALVAQAAAATSRSDVQQAAAAMTRLLVHRNLLVIPLAGVFHVYGMRAGVALAEPHPSAVNQTWATLRPAA